MAAARHDALSLAPWELAYDGFNAGDERLREALTTVGNGYVGTRGSLESEEIGDTHNPGTYIAGLYNRAKTEVAGRLVENSDFVNCPNWTRTTVHIGDGRRLSPHTCEVVEYRHWTDLRAAITLRELTLRDGRGRITTIRSERFASMQTAHLVAMRLTVTPLNYNGRIEIRSSLDGAVRNYLVERYRDLEQRHLRPVSTEDRINGVFLQMRTIAAGHLVCMRARTTAAIEGSPSSSAVERVVSLGPERATESFQASVREGRTFVLEKLVSIATGVDFDVPDPRSAVEQVLRDAGTYPSERTAHVEAWRRLWEDADVEVEGDPFTARTLRLHSYHLLSSAGPHNVDLDTGFPARGLHGEAYRGHIFWDELFIMPFYTLRFPSIARSHLMYRYRRLDAARELARTEGFEGAMYPWQSADTGGPESQELHYNPESGEWDPDLSRLQRHVSIAIAYDVYTYYYATGDEAFLHDYGLEMLLEIARFWACIAEYDESDGRYHIGGVMGPDEFHEKYPEAPADQGGMRDNAYTNIMAAWLLHKISETWEHRPAQVRERLTERISFRPEEISRWRTIISGLAVVIDERGLISQFAGYMDLQELDWDDYRSRYDDIRRMDRILKAEGDSPDRYKVAKQADVLMVFYLLAPGQVAHILGLMGYDVPDGEELLRCNYEYYVQRTSHGSTLSWIVHCAILRYLDRHRGDQWPWFVECLESDLFDTQGGTTQEGIHCGVMAGSLDVVVTAFAGVNLYRDHIELSPRLPERWQRVALKIVHQGERLRIEVAREDGGVVVTVTRLATSGRPISLRCAGLDHQLPPGEPVAVRVETT